MFGTAYRKAWEVVGYTFDGGLYCSFCARAKWGDSLDDEQLCEQSEVRPVFVSDDLSDCGEGCEQCGDWVQEPVQHDAGTCVLAEGCRKLTMEQ